MESKLNETLVTGALEYLVANTVNVEIKSVRHYPFEDYSFPYLVGFSPKLPGYSQGGHEVFRYDLGIKRLYVDYGMIGCKKAEEAGICITEDNSLGYWLDTPDTAELLEERNKKLEKRRGEFEAPYMSKGTERWLAQQIAAVKLKEAFIEFQLSEDPYMSIGTSSRLEQLIAAKSND